jgi:excisionase family DNA binding protein
LPEPLTKPTQVERVLLRENEAARSLGLSIRTLFSLRQQGAISFVKHGRAVLYRPSALEAWAAANEVKNCTT